MRARGSTFHHATRSPPALIHPARILGLLLILTAVALVVAPWQQTAAGNGRVAAYAPMDREQIVEAPIQGRVVKWFVVEGSAVTEGDPLVEMIDVDSDYVARLERNKVAIEERISASEDQSTAYQSQTEAYRNAREMAIEAAALKVEMAAQKIKAAEQKLDAERAALSAARANSERTRMLFEEGLTSRRNVELAEMYTLQAEAKVKTAQAGLTEAKANETAMSAERLLYGSEAMAKVASAEASRQKAGADAAKAREDLTKVESDLARQATGVVVAPRTGTVLRLAGHQSGKILERGDELAVVIPDTSARAVELWIDGNDAPLVTPGRKVRLQFEGWPAVQFTGWPSVAVGTFGGQVALVDATSRRAGEFRVLVVPDPADDPWPADRHLRQGARAKGWILLDRVRLGYELWRRLNGFPASSTPEAPESVEAPKRVEKK